MLCIWLTGWEIMHKLKPVIENIYTFVKTTSNNTICVWYLSIRKKKKSEIKSVLTWHRFFSRQWTESLGTLCIPTVNRQRTYSAANLSPNLVAVCVHAASRIIRYIVSTYWVARLSIVSVYCQFSVVLQSALIFFGSSMDKEGKK